MNKLMREATKEQRKKEYEKFKYFTKKFDDTLKMLEGIYGEVSDSLEFATLYGRMGDLVDKLEATYDRDVISVLNSLKLVSEFDIVLQEKTASELEMIAKTVLALSPADVERIKLIKEKSTITLGEARKYLDVIKDCAGLSSGTLATLTGKREYAELDEIRDFFVYFVETLIPKKHYENWHKAWDDFASKYGDDFIPPKKFKQPKNK